MSTGELRAAVAARDARRQRRRKLEASGGVTLDNVAEIAATGVELISVGALTHSAPALDLSMLLESADAFPAARRAGRVCSTWVWVGESGEIARRGLDVFVRRSYQEAQRLCSADVEMSDPVRHAGHGAASSAAARA